ncbi:hypothetical protein ABZ916_39695 [Streptomyces sp. NPDC046853]|uniref:hypothetical protein n=1 Tax=Streptomyces sp. NPDC046853 TaxID=3154920 RepID=UPI0033D1A3D9
MADEEQEEPRTVSVPRGYDWRVRDWEEHVETAPEVAAQWDDRAWARAGALWRADDSVQRWMGEGSGWDM